MVDYIRQLEKAACRLEPQGDERAQLLNRVAGYAHAFLDGLPDAPAYGRREEDGRALYASPLSEEGQALDDVLALLYDHVDALGVHPSPRVFSYIPGSNLYLAALGDYLAALSNRYSGHFFSAAGAVRVENQLIRWLADLVAYPATAAGNLTSGGSLASLWALLTARDACGVAGERLPRSVVYVTEHVHHSIIKALHVLGLGGCPVRRIGVDDGYRMDPSALEEAVRADQHAGLQPWLVVASAGTTNTGAVDPLSAIGAIATAHGLWFHIDGAYGGFFALCPEGRAVLQGMEASDSIILDPHKTLFLPYGSGSVLVKDGHKMHAANRWHADYAQDVPEQMEELSPSDLSPELSRHFRGLRMWLPLKVLGVAPFRAALSEKIHLARYFYERLRHEEGFEVGPYPDLSIVTYRYVPGRGDADAFNLRLIRAIQQEGRIFLTSTRVGGKVVLRLAVSCFRTHLDHIDEAIAILRRTARQLVEEG